ncbi:MAG: hypothetical protein ABUK01_05125 [Leptospirales bacterium]
MAIQPEYKNEAEDLTLQVSEEGNTITVKWLGRSTEINPGIFLGPVFNDIFSDESKTVIMNFEELTYMNSSTITPLISVLEKIKNGTGSCILQYSDSLKWQELSFGALHLFKTSDNRVDIVGV